MTQPEPETWKTLSETAVSSGFFIPLWSQINYFGQQCPHIGFYEVKFKKLFEYPYEEYDFSHWDIKGYEDPEPFIKKLKANRKLKDKIGKYYEMLIARHQDIISQYHDLKEYKVSLNIDDEFDNYVLALSESLLTDYPVFRMMKTIFNEHFYGVLKEYINPTYYFLKEYDLSEGSEPQSRRIM